MDIVNAKIAIKYEELFSFRDQNITYVYIEDNNKVFHLFFDMFFAEYKNFWLVINDKKYIVKNIYLSEIELTNEIDTIKVHIKDLFKKFLTKELEFSI